jgi:hypothetical protein
MIAVFQPPGGGYGQIRLNSEASAYNNGETTPIWWGNDPKAIPPVGRSPRPLAPFTLPQSGYIRSLGFRARQEWLSSFDPCVGLSGCGFEPPDPGITQSTHAVLIPHIEPTAPGQLPGTRTWSS